MIQYHRVSKSYGSRIVLHPTDLRIDAGEIVALIGPSGSGKSTLLRLAIGLLRPSSGAVTFDGTPVEPASFLSIRRRTGYVIQDGGLFPHLTARENVTLLARHLGWEDERVRRRVGELTDLTRFPGDGLSRYPVQLSGGQRQRVALMRALMLDPDLLLLDEPLGALDPVIRRELQDDLRRIFRTLKKTVLVVTHHVGEAAFFGDRLVLLDNGRMEQAGTLEDLQRRPASDLVTRFMDAERHPPSPSGEAS